MHPVLSINNLTKFYGPIRALHQVSFDVPEASVFGILGPNGSGKTTLLGIIMDILKPGSGNYLWKGQPGSATMRRHIGTLLETPNFYHYLSGEKNLVIAAEIKQKGKEDIDRLLRLVNLWNRKDSKFSTYSLGMKQRLAIASTLLGNPDILVFDEPTNGLDPAGIAEIRELIRELNRMGKTIIIASHILDEVEKVCTHAVIIQQGELKAKGTVKEIHDMRPGEETLLEIMADDMDQLLAIIREMPGVGEIKPTAQGLLVQVSGNLTAREVNAYCFARGIVLTKLNTRKKTLESSFLELTGNQSQH